MIITIFEGQHSWFQVEERIYIGSEVRYEQTASDMCHAILITKHQDECQLHFFSYIFWSNQVAFARIEEVRFNTVIGVAALVESLQQRNSTTRQKQPTFNTPLYFAVTF